MQTSRGSRPDTGAAGRSVSKVESIVPKAHGKHNPHARLHPVSHGTLKTPDCQVAAQDTIHVIAEMTWTPHTLPHTVSLPAMRSGVYHRLDTAAMTRARVDRQNSRTAALAQRLFSATHSRQRFTHWTLEKPTSHSMDRQIGPGAAPGSEPGSSTSILGRLGRPRTTTASHHGLIVIHCAHSTVAG
jgi:hypothetical protein